MSEHWIRIYVVEQGGGWIKVEYQINNTGVERIIYAEN